MVEVVAAPMGQEMSQFVKTGPRLYHTRTPIFWWIKKWASVKFITRELTSVFVASYAVVLLLQIRALFNGPEAYSAFGEMLKTPLSLALHAIGFLFVLFHSVTWFNLAPKAMVIRLGKKVLPGSLIAASNYAAWLAASAVIAWIIL